MPNVLHYQIAALCMALSGLAFLFLLNQALQRLVAMLPDENLRIEAGLFTNLNLWLLTALLLMGALWTGLLQIDHPHLMLANLVMVFSRVGVFFFLLLLLLPLALTMTLVWRIKELILTSVFSGKA